MVCAVRRGTDVLGYLVVDSTVGGRSCGGVRLLPDVAEDEMRMLAASMTLKYGFLGLPQGGAKAGIRGDPGGRPAERRERLRAFAEAIAPLLRRRVFLPGPDMGTSGEDIGLMLASVGVRPGRRGIREAASGHYTAFSVLVSARVATLRLGGGLDGRTVAVEGFGRVGSALAALMAREGARVVAVSTARGALYDPAGLDVERLAALGRREGSRVVDLPVGARRLEREALLELPVDLLCPCARHHTIHEGNAGRVRARVICPGANNPLTPGAEERLRGRGVVCVPDFVANCGGVLGGTMAFASVPAARIEAFMARHLARRVARVLSEAERVGSSPRDVAASLAMRRFQEVRRGVESPTPLGRLFGLALEGYRRGLIPAALVGRLSLPYFARTLA